MGNKTSHVSDIKKKEVAELVTLMLESPVIAAVNMDGLPAPPLQKMRSQLRDKITLVMNKRRLMNVAISQAKGKRKGIEELSAYLKGMPALIFTEDNPFSLFKVLKKSKTPAPAKAGQEAPFDIIVPKGPTPFAPGPVIAELGQAGISATVEDGKVVIKQDSVAVKAGEIVNQKSAELLSRLGVHPMEIGLNITAVLEDGQIYTSQVLDIDEDKFMADLSNASSWALNLACEAAYPVKETIEILIGKAFSGAKAVALEGNILSPDVIDELIGKAERGAQGVKSAGSIEVGAAKPAEEKKEEAPKDQEKAEEKKEEPEIPKEEAVLETPTESEEPVEEKKEEPETPKEPETTEEKVAAMVDKTQKFNKGDVASADDLLDEVDSAVEEPKEPAVEKKVEELAPETPKEEPTEETPTLSDLEEKKAEKKKELKKEKEAHDEAERLAAELVQSGTLRK
ncbi:MAG: 50S ribosomal protein L10 [Nanoarchaeota archaeon]|nr:50S ribosomal protein L10 [Nanoarchaeota archaeon]